MKEVVKNRMGPIWVAHMGCSYGAHIVAQMGACFCANWVHLKTTLMKAVVSAAARRCACFSKF